MNSQIFKKNVPEIILFELLDKICEKNNNNYVLSKTAYKHACYHDYIDDFCNTLKDYYHKSKEYYVDRKLNYTKFVTIIRQICKTNKILYTSNILYNKSNYDILYYIYIPGM